MKKILIISFISILFFSACSRSVAPLTNTVNNETSPPSEQNTDPYAPSEITNGRWQIVPEKSVITWKGQYIIRNSGHNGTIEVKNGFLEIANNEPGGGEVVIDMTSIKNLDLPEERRDRLEGHLKSADFFDTENYPEAKLVITDIRDLRGSEVARGFTVRADLTIKGITNQISFPADIRVNEGMMTAEAFINIDRSLWNVRFGSGKFFTDLGDNIIDDIIGYEIKLSLTQ